MSFFAKPLTMILSIVNRQNHKQVKQVMVDSFAFQIDWTIVASVIGLLGLVSRRPTQDGTVIELFRTMPASRLAASRRAGLPRSWTPALSLTKNDMIYLVAGAPSQFRS
jgi:Na+/H+-dicarboxylate symporter